jgi:GNAT superfamily N-acetyltransferase
VNIRPATLADIPWLIDAAGRAQKEATHYADLPASPGAQYKRLVSVLQFPDAVCLHVVDDGTGFVCGALEPAVWFEATYAIQSLLWVDTRHRGSGRAWRLVASFERWAREHGARRIYSGVSSGISEEHTGRVARFYRKMGYADHGPSFYKELA